MALISQGELIWRESEQECCDRWLGSYGLERALGLATVMRKTTCRPLAAYYRSVETLIGEFQAPKKTYRPITTIRDPAARNEARAEFNAQKQIGKAERMEMLRIANDRFLASLIAQFAEGTITYSWAFNLGKRRVTDRTARRAFMAELLKIASERCTKSEKV